MDEDWTEIGGGGDTEMWDKTSGTIIGRYIRKQSDVGRNKSNIYTLETDSGPVGVWGSTVLDTKFESIKLNWLVRIEYLGKMAGKNGANYHDFKVSFRQDEEAKVMNALGEDEPEKPSDDIVPTEVPSGDIDLSEIPF